MIMTPFDDDWTVARFGEDSVSSVTLPHDAMIGEPRGAANPSGSHGAYFPGGRYVYRKTFIAPAVSDGHEHRLFFEGVYGKAVVRINGVEVGTSVSGYREFSVPLGDARLPGEQNEIEVDVDNTDQPNSRWYTGSGIYRHVWLQEVATEGFADDGIRFTTRLSGGRTLVDAAISVATATATAGAEASTVSVALLDGDTEVAAASAQLVGSGARLQLEVPRARLWSDRSPNLYRAVVRLTRGAALIDEREVRVGLRTIEVDARRGLRINGEGVLLKGACVHHDNGPLGAVTLRASEFRRARLLKENGFNAVRSSHNPLSRDFLDACDELGLYVMDELTDIWFVSKTAKDVAPLFDELWPDDARAMVAKDRNHPSVIMYSIGNEIAETATDRGIAVTEQISDFIRQLDPDRPTTISINFLLNVMSSFGRSPFATDEHASVPAPAKKKPSAITSTMANVMANKIGSMMQTVARLPRADKFTREALSKVDVPGYNYAWARYKGDARRYPDRVVVGSESLPGDIAKIWPLVTALPNVIGDFMWTGWDYLGESGIGTWSYGDNASPSFGSPYPGLIAGCGAIDLTGIAGAQMLLARAAWGDLDSPQIAVRPLNHAGEKVVRTAWRSTDAVQSWAWRGYEGTTAELEVFSSDDEVELLVNGRSLGRKRVGAKNGFVARYSAPYERGEVVAVGYRNGRENGRSSLRSAGTPALRIVADRNAMVADGQDLAHIVIELADADGVIETTADDVVTVSVEGAGRLAALASAEPSTEESFVTDTHSTWAGRALAIVRSTTTTGEITVSVSTVRHGTATVTLRAAAPVSGSRGPRSVQGAGVDVSR